MLGQHLQQQPQPTPILADTTLDDQATTIIDHRDVVVVFGPLDPAEQEHAHPRLLDLQSLRSKLAQGTRAALMEGLNGPTPDQPFMAPTRRRDPGLRVSGHCRP